DCIYIGTDTHYRIDIGREDPFVVRVQNTSGERAERDLGSAIGIAVDPIAIQVLKD
ncbi:MAG: TOBE domain-containing protein, partial [Gammaproteobacteria bacterium]|nr:TOBE domain-containing protein [Gammaproteobacteria bacterium]